MSAWVGDLGLNSGKTQSVYRLDTSQMNLIGRKALRPGETWDLPEGLGSVEFVGYTRWASLQIAHDPGQGIALIAVTFAISGLLLSLFVKRRRMWVRARPTGTGSTVVAAGLARGDDERLESLVNDVATAAASGRRKG